MDSETLARMFDFIVDQEVDVHSILVTRNGHIVAEAYAPPNDVDQQHNMQSAGKSLMSALIGIAIGEGLISGVDAPVLELLPDRSVANDSAEKRAMTLEHLLTMSSGLDWRVTSPGTDIGSGDDTCLPQMVESEDWVQFVVDRPMSDEPGSTYNCNSGGSHLLSAILQEAAGMSSLDYARERLFEPLGIDKVDWRADPSGVNSGTGGQYLTPRDMAKLGYLFLNNGRWEDQQVIPAEWEQASTQPSQSVQTGVDYGYQWWIWAFPFDAYGARGSGGQNIMVVPSWTSSRSSPGGCSETTRTCRWSQPSSSSCRLR